MGNAHTRPSANTAIDYEEDRSKKVPLHDEAPNSSQSSSGDQQRRLRMFSTFQSAARPNLSAEGANSRVKLSDLLASGVQVPMEPGEFQAESYFQKRLSHYEFKVKEELKGIKILFCKNLDEAIYNEQVLGKPISDQILMRPSLRSNSVGDRAPSEKAYEHELDIYIPEELPGSRRLFAFIVSGDDSQLLVKARAVLMNQSDKARVEYIGQHMNEREEKMRAMLKNMMTDSVMTVFNPEDLVEMFSKTKDTPKPPYKYLLGAKDILLAYRVFAPANRDSIVANLIFVATDVTFLEYLASSISTAHPIRVILVDLRGFGYSGGKRGHTPSINQVFRDIKQVIKHVRGLSSKPVILGGYMMGGGMIANYNSFKEKAPVDAYLMMAPLFGRSWMGAWKEQLTSLEQEKIISSRLGHLRLAKMTGGRISGSKYVFKTKVDENTYDFSPRHVNKMTANYVLSFQVPKETKVFSQLSAPVGVFMAERDEFMDAKKMQDFIQPGLTVPESKFVMIEGKSGLQALMTAADDIAGWITNLKVVKPWKIRAKEPHKSIISEADLETVKDIIPSPIFDSIKKGIEKHVYDRHPRQTDCDQCHLTYDIFEPTYLPGRPIGVLLFIAPRCQAHILPTLAEVHRILVFRVDPWELEGEKVNTSPKAIWKFLKSSIKLIKSNFPGAPFYIGGIGYGASIVMGYGNREDRHPVTGYVLIDPLGDLKAPANKQYASPDGEKANVASLIYGMSIGKAGDSEKRKILDNAGFVPHRLSSVTALSSSKDIVGDIKSMDASALVILNGKCEIMNNGKLQGPLSAFLKPPFKGVEFLDGDLYGCLGGMATIIGRWVNQLSTSVAPRVSLKLSNLSMANFEPIEMIGKGTFGKVWLVRHIGTSRFLALKVLEKDTVIESKQTVQVVREKEVLSKCSECPFIVGFNGSFQDRKRLYLVMEFVIGGELFTRLNNTKKMSVDDARFYLAEVIIAISYLHQKQIVYRDLKPENIVLDALGHIRLVDFGFARQLNRGRCTSFCGSPFYIAPEMLSNSSYGISVDIWALGVLLFELLTGNPPFSGSTANEVYRRILFSNVDVPNNLDSDSRDLLYSLLDPSPDSRLGNKNGLEDVKKHRWFKGIDWERVGSKQLQPPYQPHFTFEGDTGNFTKVGGAEFDFEEADTDGKNDPLFIGFAT